MDTNVYVHLTYGTASMIFLAFVGFLVFYVSKRGQRV